MAFSSGGGASIHAEGCSRYEFWCACCCSGELVVVAFVSARLSGVVGNDTCLQLLEMRS